MDFIPEAVEEGNVGSLADAVRYEQIPCGVPNRVPSSPACLPGEPEGTRVKALRVSAGACSYDYFRPKQVTDALADFLGFRGRLYAAGRSRSGQPWTIDVLFVRQAGGEALSPQIKVDNAGRIRGIVLMGACATPRDVASEWVGPYLLGPRTRR